MTTTFDDLYDAETVAAIDSWRAGHGVEPVRGWKGGVTAAAVVVAGLTGVRDVVEDEVEPVIEEPRVHDADTAAEAVTVLFVPGDPAGTVAVVRPWLVRRPGPALLAVRRSQLAVR